MDTYIEGKWLVQGTKHCNANELQSLDLSSGMS